MLVDCVAKHCTVQEKCPRLSAYMDRMRSDKRLAPVIRPTELHAIFIRSYAAGAPEYDAKL